MTSEECYERVRVFLRELYGKDPEPLRSYLTRQEARDLMQRCPAAEIVTQDLDISGYGGKWTSAVQNEIMYGHSPDDWQFWYGARLTFLELGGCYKDGMQPPRR